MAGAQGTGHCESTRSAPRGAFIVVEGLDRAGKTTQTTLLQDALRATGRKITPMRFPGELINSYLQSHSELDDHTIHLLFSANRWEKAQTIIATLNSGNTIICDRYYYSGMVYSAAKQNPQLTLDWARAPDVGLPRPDIVIFLDIDPEEAQRRGGYGNEKYEKIAMQEKVRELFLGLQTIGEDEAVDMKVINAGRSIEVVAEEILLQTMTILKEVEIGQRGKELAFVSNWPQGAAGLRIEQHRHPVEPKEN